MSIDAARGPVRVTKDGSLRSVSAHDWTNWRWQQRNALRDVDALRRACGGWPEDLQESVVANLRSRKIQVTPYYVELIRSTSTDDLRDNPLWRQVVPFWSDEGDEAFDGATENWESPHEMVNAVCQHKYDDRVLVRSINVCNAYCQFCFEALRTIDAKSGKAGGSTDAYEDTYRYVEQQPQVREVIFSGGDPLMMSDQVLAERMARTRAISPELLLRVHSRSLTFNPFRVTSDLVDALRASEVSSFGVHVAHPAEISDDFVAAVRKISSAVPILLANIPLLRGINDDVETLRTLFLRLYRVGVKPYYLYHYMPHSPGASEYRTSVRAAISMMHTLKRRVTNVAMPEYVLPDIGGKFTVPLIADDSDPPMFENIDGTTYYAFTNWKGERRRWYDGGTLDD